VKGGRRIKETSIRVKAFVNGVVRTFDAASRRFTARDALVIDDDGRAAGYDVEAIGAPVERIDLAGGCLVPAFADAHVHLTETGYYLGVRDFGGIRDARAFAAAVAALPDEPRVLAGRFDDAGWDDGAIADAAVLDARFPDRPAMLVRVDVHSCLVNKAAFALLDLPSAIDGVERGADGRPTGRLVRAANWAAQAAYLADIPLTQRRAAESRALDAALAAGAVQLHAQLIGLGNRDAYAAEIAALRALSPANLHPKICETDVAIARDLGLPYIGGDVFLDGSLGSRTAALQCAYHDHASTGALRFDDATVARYFADAEASGISAGVHAIGDAAIGQALAAIAAAQGDRPSPRTRHFIEHFELATEAQIAACARLGVTLSMQPLFDATWGADGGMYDVRLGRARKRTMNAFGRIRRAGARIAGGDDSPVCALDPLASMQAMLDHHEPSERLDAHEALAAFTADAAWFGRVEGTTGTLALGEAADCVVLDADPFAREAFAGIRVRATYVAGRRVR
jgi:predicted amidohydrolase YtcJ